MAVEGIPKVKTSSNKKYIVLFAFLAVFLLVSLLGAAAVSYSVLKKSNFSTNSGLKSLITDIRKSLEVASESESKVQPKMLNPEREYSGTSSSNSNSTTKTEIVINSNTNPSPAPVTKPCYKYTIYEGKFTSSKCYSVEDYEALAYNLSKYQGAEFAKDSAKATIEFTCDEEFFKESCSNAKKKKDQAESDLKEYGAKIEVLISRGW